MWGIVAIAGLVTVAGPAAAGAATAPPGDGPTSEPVEVWSADVGCDPAACTVEFTDTAVYVLEHETPGDPDVARLTAYDPTTGDEHWSLTAAHADRVTISHEAIVLGDKSHVEVIDPDTGTSRFSRPGRLVAVNDYGVLLVATPADAAPGGTARQPTIDAVDGVDGSTRWTVETGMDVGAVCRDIVVLIPDAATAPRPFQVLEHHTGAVRWSGEGTFDPGTDTLECSGPWLYTTNGDSITEWDSVVGWLNWETPVDGGAAAVELYRDVALVTSADAATVTAFERETGAELWTRSAAAIGAVLSPRAWLRRDGATVLTVPPTTGEVVNRIDLDPPDGAPVRFVAATECRLVVVTGPTVTTYGARDLAPSWSLALNGVPDDIGVVADTLVVRHGPRLVGHRSPPTDADLSGDDLPGCTF